MGSTGSNNLIGLNWDNSTVWVGNESSISVGITVGSIRISSIANGEDMSKLSKVNSSGKSNLGCVSWDNSTVGVSHQSGGRDSQTGRKNQKLHVERRVVFCASVQT